MNVQYVFEMKAGVRDRGKYEIVKLSMQVE